MQRNTSFHSFVLVKKVVWRVTLVAADWYACSEGLNHPHPTSNHVQTLSGNLVSIEYLVPRQISEYWVIYTHVHVHVSHYFSSLTFVSYWTIFEAAILKCDTGGSSYVYKEVNTGTHSAHFISLFPLAYSFLSFFFSHFFSFYDHI